MDTLDTHRLCSDYIQYISEVRQFAPPTVRTYRYVLMSFSKHLGGDIQELTLIELDNYISYFSQEHELKPSSINTIRCVLRSFFLYVDRYRDIRLKFDYSMIRQVKTPRPKIEHITPEEVTRSMKRLKTRQDKLMVATLFSTGMRIGEIVKFSVEDFHYTEITVRGKGSKDRVIPIDESLSRSIQAYIQDNRILTGPIFRHQTGSCLMPYTVSGLRKRLQRQLGDMYRKPHSFRHGIATELLRSGMDIRSLQTFLGHENINTTMIYTHISDRFLAESYNKHFQQIGFNTTKAIDNSA